MNLLSPCAKKFWFEPVKNISSSSVVIVPAVSIWFTEDIYLVIYTLVLILR